MEFEVQDWMLLTLPEHLREKGSELINVSKIDEEERLQKHSYKFGRYHSHRRHGRHHSNESQLKMKIQAEKAAIPLAIARLIMELWSPKMQRHAEKLILQKGVEHGYIKEHQLKWIHVLEDQEDEDERTWLIDNQDDVIMKLVWDVFDMKTHYSQVDSHRSWVQKSYYRLKDFMPTLQEEIIERHDLTKFAFSQAVGYTLKWVHSTYHTIWKSACDFHLFNEPHHPQAWSKANTPEEKRIKLQKWLSAANDSHTGCPYGLDIANMDLNSEDFAEPFLLESYVDMVGVEWERKKGMDVNISTRKLAYIDDKFLVRYSKKQHKIISNLIEKITQADESWKVLNLTEGEKVLLSTVPPHRRGKFASQLEIQKNNEEKRMLMIVPAATPGAPDSEHEQMIKKAMKKAEEVSFYIMIARVVVELWDASFRKRVENLIFRKAIEEKHMKSNDIDWIMVFDNKDNSQVECSSEEGSYEPPLSDEDIVKLLWNEFKLSEHFIQVQQHRHWIKQSYLRLARFMPELSEEVIERHDLTKLALSQSIGYTLKWVHNINFPVWRKACDKHLNNEPHHPQMWCNRNTVENKQNCLEKWLGGRDSYGVVLSTLDLNSENMARVFLLEILIDMVAVEWERNKGQKPDLTYTELIYMEDKFLSRYTPEDKTFITELIQVIRQADDAPAM